MVFYRSNRKVTNEDASELSVPTFITMKVPLKTSLAIFQGFLKFW